MFKQGKFFILGRVTGIKELLPLIRHMIMSIVLLQQRLYQILKTEKKLIILTAFAKNNYASNLRWVSRLENAHNDITSKHHADRILETHRTNEFRNKLSAARNDPEFQKRIRPNYENAWKKRRGSKNICHRKKVRCIETGEIWNSCTDLAKQFNVSSSAVYNWINHRKEHSKAGPCYGALHFEYVNKEDCNVH